MQLEDEGFLNIRLKGKRVDHLCIYERAQEFGILSSVYFTEITRKEGNKGKRLLKLTHHL